MDAKRIGSAAFTVLLVVLILWWRLGRRDDFSAEVRADTIAMMTAMDDYATHKPVIDPMIDRAHDVAFNAAYTMGGKRRRENFDPDRYEDAFFRSLYNQCDMLGRHDIKKALLKFQNGDGSSEFSRAGSFAPDLDAPDAGAPPAAPEPQPAAPQTGDASSPGAALMTRAEFDATPDDQIEGILFDRISKAVASAAHSEQISETAAVRKLPKSHRMIYVTWIVEAEVNNGGFDQFFTNNGALTKMAVPAFSLIEAKKHATVTRRAIAAYARANPDQEIFKVDKTVKGYLKKYKDKSVAAVDKLYFNLSEDISALCVKYIRANPDEFSAL